MKKLLICITMCFLLGLTACSNNEETKPNDDSKLSLEESSYYIDIENGMSSLDGAFALNEDETLEIDGDYDLTKAGKYEVKIVVTNKAGEKTEHNKTIIVDTKDKLDEIKNEEISNKPSEPSVDVEQPEETKEPEKEEVKVEPKPTPTTKPEPQKPTASTNASDYGLDGNNAFVKAAMNHVGKTGICQDVANAISNEAGYPAEEYKLVIGYTNWGEVESRLQVGDGIRYHNLGGRNIEHMAVYLGNGLAFHGNWTDGLGTITSVYQDAESYASYRHSSLFEEINQEEDLNPNGEFNIDMCWIKATEHVPNYPNDYRFDDLLDYCAVYAPERVDWSEPK